VRKGLTSSPEDWSYSSFQFYAKGQPNNLLTPDLFYSEFGKNSKERQVKYSNLVIESAVEDSYSENTKKAWGGSYQRYKEQEKVARKEKEK